MGTFRPLANVIAELEYWLRLGTFLHEPLQDACLSVLHNDNNDASYNGLPRDPVLLYQTLSTTHKQAINLLVKKRVLSQDQVDILLPPNIHQTISKRFDVTLIIVLIINCTTLAPPLNGWRKDPSTTDISKGANILRARAWRNFVHHCEPAKLDSKCFNQKWKEGEHIISCLGSSYDTKSLKICTLDPQQAIVLNSLQTYVSVLEKDQTKVKWLQIVVEDLRKQIAKKTEEGKQRTVNYTGCTVSIEVYKVFALDSFTIF